MSDIWRRDVRLIVGHLSGYLKEVRLSSPSAPPRVGLRQDAGFTIQELLVVLNVSFLLVSLCLMVFLSTNKLISSWQKKQILIDAVNRSLQRISLDAQRSTKIALVNDSILILEGMRQKKTIYQFGEKGIWRDSVSICQPQNIKTTITISNPDMSEGFQRLFVDITGKHGSLHYRSVVEVETRKSSAKEFKDTKPSNMQ